MSREFEQHRREPANANAHAGALAGEDGQFPPAPPTNEKLIRKGGLFRVFANRSGCSLSPSWKMRMPSKAGARQGARQRMQSMHKHYLMLYCAGFKLHSIDHLKERIC